MQSKKRMRKRYFISFLELSSEPGSFGLWGSLGNYTLQSCNKIVKGLPYTYITHTLVNLTENKTCNE
jgi:hypothetical protein